MRLQSLRMITNIVILALLTGCIGRPPYETIVLSDSATSTGQQTPPYGSPYHVSTIYRPAGMKESSYRMLGWIDDDTIGAYRIVTSKGGPEPVNLLQLSPPYEEADDWISVDDVRPETLVLSPDGQTLIGWPRSMTSTEARGQLYLLTITRTATRRILLPETSPESGLATLRWSSNHRYVAYIANDNTSKQTWITVYDTTTEKLQSYQLHGPFAVESNASVMLSNDGEHALIDDGKQVVAASRSGDAFEARYDHTVGGGDSVWVDESRFLFLGQDGTLFQYSLRSGELAVVLEHIRSFALAPDQRSIAYTTLDDEAIFAGKLQGNNVLYQEMVYQGVVPNQLTWNPASNTLLVQGIKWFAKEISNVPMPAPANEADPQPQTLVILFA